MERRVDAVRGSAAAARSCLRRVVLTTQDHLTDFAVMAGVLTRPDVFFSSITELQVTRLASHDP